MSSEEDATRQRALRAERREAALRGEMEHLRIKLAEAEEQRESAKKVATERKRKLHTLHRRVSSLQATLEAATAESREKATQVEVLKRKLEGERKRRRHSDRTAHISSILSAQMVGIDADVGSDNGQEDKGDNYEGYGKQEAKDEDQEKRKSAPVSPSPSLVNSIAVTPSSRYRSMRKKADVDASSLAISMNASNFLVLLDCLIGLHINAVSSVRQLLSHGSESVDGLVPAQGECS